MSLRGAHTDTTPADAAAQNGRHASRRDEKHTRRPDPRLSLTPSADRTSWFGATGAADDDAELNLEAEARLTQELDEESDATAPGSQALSPGAMRAERQGESGFQRIYKVFLAARVALGLALLATQVALSYLGFRPDAWVLAICSAYAVQTLAWWLLPQFRRATSPKAMAQLRSPQWLGSIGVDLAVFSILHALSGSSSLNFVALLVLPVLMSGLMTPRPMALATTAGVTLTLLTTAWLSVLQGLDPALRLTQSGLAGTGLFVATLLAAELGNRLAREERSARGSLDLARQQAQLNRLVIDEMQEGVLVVDRRGRVRAANPAARALLSAAGMVRAPPFQMRGVRVWEPLVAGVENAFAQGQWPAEGADVNLQFDAAHLRSLRVRVRFTRHRASRSTEELCVLFLEDLRNVQARSRQEKLAAMGRVSVGIAHEIRNPLAAIDQANALLAEDCREPGQQRLTAMVSSNVQRLKRIVDDVMALAPGAAVESVTIDAGALVQEVCQDWARANAMETGAQSMLKLTVPTHAVMVNFEPEHLRRVIVNLLDNAFRHAPKRAGALAVTLEQASEPSVELCVASEGEPIRPDVERHLFEPFFSTRSRGTGLGLYICRELCERYGANIEYAAYKQGQLQGNRFVVSLRRAMPMSNAAIPTSPSNP